MGKVSKNAKTNRKAQKGSKDYVLIKAVKTKKVVVTALLKKLSQGQSEGFLAKD